MESYTKYLEMIQGVINRMASNSFLIKGWCITISAAILAIAADKANTAASGISQLAWLVFLPVLMFWLLDAYYLRQERLFRKLYDHARSKNIQDVDFSMSTTSLNSQVASWLGVAFSRTLLIFYGTLLLLSIVFAVFVGA